MCYDTKFMYIIQYIYSVRIVPKNIDLDVKVCLKLKFNRSLLSAYISLILKDQPDFCCHLNHLIQLYMLNQQHDLDLTYNCEQYQNYPRSQFLNGDG